jgi:DnaK suppressor protein
MNIDTQTHLTTVRNLLQYRRRDLQAESHAVQQRRAQAVAEIELAEVVDLKDRSQRDQATDLARVESLRLGNELLLVEAALQRLDAGTYGDCLDCGEPIAFDRLLVQPEAARCAACQTVVERQFHDAR